MLCYEVDVLKENTEKRVERGRIAEGKGQSLQKQRKPLSSEFQ